jgi:hypothetical protein
MNTTDDLYARTRLGKGMWLLLVGLVCVIGGLLLGMSTGCPEGQTRPQGEQICRKADPGGGKAVPSFDTEPGVAFFISGLLLMVAGFVFLCWDAVRRDAGAAMGAGMLSV